MTLQPHPHPHHSQPQDAPRTNPTINIKSLSSSSSSSSSSSRQSNDHHATQLLKHHIIQLTNSCTGADSGGGDTGDVGDAGDAGDAADAADAADAGRSGYSGNSANTTSAHNNTYLQHYHDDHNGDDRDDDDDDDDRDDHDDDDDRDDHDDDDDRDDHGYDDDRDDHHKKDHDDMERAARILIQGVGDNPNREGLIDTPKRYVKALLQFTTGYKQSLSQVIGDAKFTEDHHELVIVRDIDLYSLCEHHLVPFFGTVSIGYIPDKKVLGLSKFARIVDVFAKRFQVQERITTQVADAIMQQLQPKGVAVHISARHLCMMMRGVRQSSSITTTVAKRGCFENDRHLWREFIDLLPKNI